MSAASPKKQRALSRLCLEPSEVELAEVVEQHISRVLWATGGEISLAAELLGLHRRTLQRILDRSGQRRGRARRPS